MDTPMTQTDLDAVADELGNLKRVFHASIANAYQQGLSVPRILGIVGWSATRHVLGDEIVQPYNRNPDHR
jgi:hypothetical protein